MLAPDSSVFIKCDHLGITVTNEKDLVPLGGDVEVYLFESRQENHIGNTSITGVSQVLQPQIAESVRADGVRVTDRELKAEDRFFNYSFSLDNVSSSL